MSEVIAKDVQKLGMASNEGIITLYELEMTPATPSSSATIFYFHEEKTLENLTFSGNTYISFPIYMSGVEYTTTGPASRPTMQIPNVESILRNNSKLDPNKGTTTAAQEDNFLIEDLLNKRVTRRKTLQKYVGIGSAAAETSGSLQFPEVTYVVGKIVSKNELTVTLELSSPLDLEGVKIPSRVVTSVYCPWEYKGQTDSDTRDKRSACYWRSTLELDDGSNVRKPFLFFTIDNEPLILQDILTFGSVNKAPTWNTNGPQSGEPQNDGKPISVGKYTQSMFVTHGGIIYQATQLVSNNTIAPFEGSVDWQIVRIYSAWADTVNYTTIDIDTRQSPYVYYQGQVYKAVRTSGPGITDIGIKRPDISNAYWEIADTCGKLVASCKVRYQALFFTPAINRNYPAGGNIIFTPSVSGNAADQKTHGMPEANYNTQVGLPFGGFPGTRRINK